MFFALVCLAITTLSSGDAEAGAFTLEPGEGKLFVTAMATSGDRYFDRDGRLRPRARYDKYDLQAYGEYGLRDGLTAFGATGLQKTGVAGADGVGRKGFGRSEVGLRVRHLQTDGWIVSSQASVVIAGAPDEATLAVVGESDDQFDTRGLVARSFELLGKPAFIDLAAGYRLRSGDPADEIRLDATFGVRPAPRWLLIAQNFNTLGTARWTGPYALKQRIHKVQCVAIYDLTETLSLVSAAFVTPAGRDALDERGATFGIGLKF